MTVPTYLRDNIALHIRRRAEAVAEVKAIDEQIAYSIKWYREDVLKCSRREMARRLGCSATFAHEIEHGTRRPSPQWIVRLFAL